MSAGDKRPELGHADTLASPARPVHTPGLGGAPADPPVAAATELEVVDRRRYQVEAELARGGMGRILHAVDRRHGRPVAIKELLADTPALRARFRREALITARLQHPAIVPVYEAGQWSSGEPFYAMKMVKGRSLDAAIADRPELEQRIGLLPNLIAVAEAIAYAHERRVIHRDLKPANVLVGDFGETVVIDWGLAKDLTQVDAPAEAFDADPAAAPASDHATGIVPLDQVPEGVPAHLHGLTIAGHAMGTPAYMAPEQASGDVVDERADVYALGGILYHLLSGRMPYADSKTDGSALLRKVLDEPPTPVAALAAKAPPDLVAIVGKAMARRPEERYPTAKELVDDLRRFETGQLVSVRDYSSAELFRRWLRRNRVVVGLLTLLVAVVAVGGTVAITGVVRERNRVAEALVTAEQERARAEEQSRIAAGERAAAVRDRERAEQSEQEAVDASNQAQASAQALVEAWVQSRFAASIGDCYRRGRGGEAARHASLLLEVNDKRGIDKTTAVHPFGTSADACIVAASRAWTFPPGTRRGAYSLNLMVDADGDVQIGFAASDTASIRRAMARDYRARLQQCYQQLLRSAPKAGGKVEVAFTAGEDGKTSVSLLTVFDARLDRCVREEVERWVFAPPRDADGRPTTVLVEVAAVLKPPSHAGGSGGGGGGGTGLDTIDTGQFGTVGNGPATGSEYGLGAGKIVMNGHSPQAPKVTIGSASGGGDLDKEVVRRYIRQKLPQFMYCYEKQLLSRPTLRGRVDTSFQVEPDGTVSGATASGLDPEVAKCVAGVLSRLRFPVPKGGGAVSVAYPFTFEPTKD